jgi:hypothetical protein
MFSEQHAVSLLSFQRAATAQATIAGPPPRSQARAEPDAQRPPASRSLVDLPKSATNSKGCHRAATLDVLAFHHTLVRRKYRQLFSSTRCPKKPGPTGPSDALIQTIVELKSRNPRFGCPRFAHIISQTFGVDIDKNVVYRVLAKHHCPAPSGTGPSWLSFIGEPVDYQQGGTAA